MKPKRAKPRNHVSISRVDSILFECDGAVLQYCNNFISIWIDGDTSHDCDIELDVNVLARIAKVGDEQVHDKNYPE